MRSLRVLHTEMVYEAIGIIIVMVKTIDTGINRGTLDLILIYRLIKGATTTTANMIIGSDSVYAPHLIFAIWPSGQARVLKEANLK